MKNEIISSLQDGDPIDYSGPRSLSSLIEFAESFGR